MNAFWTVLSAVLPVFMIIGSGALVRRLNWLTEEADHSLMRLTVNLLVPSLILDSVMRNSALRQPGNLLLPPLLGLSTMAAGIGLAWLCRGLIGAAEARAQRTFALCTGIYNYMYLPLPLVILLFPQRPETPGVLFVFALGVELGMWVFGMLLLRGATVAQGLRRTLNPPVIAILVGLALNLSGAHTLLPGFFITMIHMLGQCAFPLGLLLIGAVVSDELGTFRSEPGARTIVTACVLRLGILPVLMLLLAKSLPCSPELKTVIVLQAAMPAAVFPIVLARHFGGDPATALRVAVGTSAAGLLTIPRWIRVGLGVVGV